MPAASSSLTIFILTKDGDLSFSFDLCPKYLNLGSNSWSNFYDLMQNLKYSGVKTMQQILLDRA